MDIVIRTLFLFKNNVNFLESSGVLPSGQTPRQTLPSVDIVLPPPVRNTNCPNVNGQYAGVYHRNGLPYCQTFPFSDTARSVPMWLDVSTPLHFWLEVLSRGRKASWM